MWPASANIFVIRDPKGFIFIDVGCGKGIRNFPRRFFQELGELNLNLADLHTIIISHAHPDHMGAMDTLIEHLDDYKQIKIFINEIEKPSALNIDLLNNSFDLALMKKYFHEGLEKRFQGEFEINHNFRLLCAMSQLPADCNLQTFKENDILELGAYRFQVINTPGHAPGHTSFYELKHHFLLSGDLIGEKGTAWYSPSSGGALGYLKSLDKIDRLDVKVIYPSHGNKFTHVKERINQIRHKILIKDEKILQKLEEGPQSMLDLINLFYKDEFSRFFPGAAIIESHLLKLEQEKRIERDDSTIWKI